MLSAGMLPGADVADTKSALAGDTVSKTLEDLAVTISSSVSRTAIGNVDPGSFTGNDKGGSGILETLLTESTEIARTVFDVDNTCFCRL